MHIKFRRLNYVCAAAVLACGACAHAAEPYRYKDPYGKWRVIMVPDGYAKHYKRAQARAAKRCTPCAVSTATRPSLRQSGRALRTDQFREHHGLVQHQSVIARAALESGIEQALLNAVIAIESGFRVDARSPKGALGLMQLMPSTAASLLRVQDMEKALIDPAINVRAGSRHLKRLLDLYQGRLDLALAAYNAGEGAVNKYDAVPPYAETQQYVREVIALYEVYRNE